MAQLVRRFRCSHRPSKENVADAKWPEILDGAESTRNRAKEKGALGAVLREDEFLEEILSVVIVAVAVIVNRVASFHEKISSVSKSLLLLSGCRTDFLSTSLIPTQLT